MKAQKTGTIRHPYAHDSLIAAAETILSKARAQKKIAHPGLKGTASETFLQDFLLQHLPSRFSVTGGLVVAQDGTPSNQTDLIVFDKLNTPMISVGAPMVPCETVVGTLEVKTTIECRHIAKAVEDCAKVKALARYKHDGAWAKDDATAPVFGTYAMPLLTHSALVGVFARDSLDRIAETFHRHYLDVPFGYQMDAILSLEQGVINLASRHPGQQTPKDGVTAVYCLPPGCDDAKGKSVLIFPDFCAGDWNEKRRVRVGPRVPWAVGSTLFVAATACGVSALAAWFRMFLGFLAPQLGPQYLPTFGHFTDDLPTGTSTKLTPLAIAVDPERLESEKGKYVAEAVLALMGRGEMPGTENEPNQASEVTTRKLAEPQL